MDQADRGQRLERATRARPAATAPTPRRRPFAAALLIASLAAAFVVVRTRSRSDAAPPRPAVSIPVPRRVPTSAPTLSSADTAALRARFHDAGACADIPGPVPRIRCDIDGVDVDARLLDARAAVATYRREAGAMISPRAGPPACARGLPDERAWSLARAPSTVAGRYRCRFEDDRAAIWWTAERGLVVHAVASDADLGALFAWWRTHHDG